MLRKYGIALITLVVAIVIITIISAVTVVSVSDTISETNFKTFVMELYNLQKLVDNYKMKNNGKLDFTTYTVKAKDYTGELKDVLETEGEIKREETVFYLLDENALEKLAIDKLTYGNQKYDETDIYAVSGTSGRVYYLYGYDFKETRYYYLTDGIITDIVLPNLDSEIAREILFIPSEFGKTREAVKVSVKVPRTVDISTVSVTTPGNSNPVISSYTMEGNYYVYTVNTNNWKGNYIVNVDYVENSENKTASYSVEEYLGVYALLYSDGELRINNTGKIDEAKIQAGNTVLLQSTDITDSTTIPWSSNATNINTVTFENEVMPTYVASWFSGCTNLTEINNMEFLDTRNVTSMESMFQNCSSLKSMDLTELDFSNTVKINSMFQNCSSLKMLDLSDLNMPKLTDMRNIVSNCGNLEILNMEKFTVPNTLNIEESFLNCAKLKMLDLTGITKVNSMYQTFKGCSAIQTIEIGTITGIVHMGGTFLDCKSLIELDTSRMDVSNVTAMHDTFKACMSLNYIDVSNWNTRKVKDMQRMFYNCYNLTNLDVSKWDTSNVSNMSLMFAGCKVLESIDVSSFNTANVGNLYGMFSDCYKLKEIDIANWNVSNVTNMGAMFYCCSQLQTVKANNWSVPNGTSMDLMFTWNSMLTYLDMRNVNFDNVTKYADIFTGVVSEGTIVVADDSAKTWVQSKLPAASKMVVKTASEL